MIQKNFMRYLLVSAQLIVFAVLLNSCGTSKKLNTDYIYFRDGRDTVNSSQQETLIQSGDILGIQVYSRSQNQEQAAIFNIPANGSADAARRGYQVSTNGNIEMPVIGFVKVAGLTKQQLENSLTLKLTDYVKNPSVLISFMQFNINVLGEVKMPGVQHFSGDRVTIIDAISAAGDLTDFGKREDITVIREQAGEKVRYTIDLRKKNMFTSPGYILQPNDIVYVAPNNYKLKSLNVDPDKQRRAGLVLTIIGIAVSVASLVVIALK